jgi:RNA polymerase sigma-70 factor (ECF subfamily)
MSPDHHLTYNGLMDETRRADLVARASSGDVDALQTLLIHYHAPLRAAIAGRIDERLQRYFEPEDVLQEAYAVAFRAATDARFEGPAAFYRWLEAIAFNRLKDHQKAIRRRKRDPARLQRQTSQRRTSVVDLAERLTAPDSTPSRKVARQEAVAALLTSLGRLTDDQRSVIRLRFLEGEPVSEVARRLGKTEPAIHMLCHRGLKALRELMASITGYLSTF